MRTQEEIVAKIHEVKNRDWIGTITGDLIPYLDFEHAKEFLKEGVVPEEWNQNQQTFTRESILAQMEKYMDFAWEKANRERGISASRSMDHYAAWTWLIGDDDQFGDLSNYQFYGKDNLVKICEHYGWDHALWDDGIRTN